LVRYARRTDGQARDVGREETWVGRHMSRQARWEGRTHERTVHIDKQDIIGRQGKYADTTRYAGHMERQDIWTGRRLRQKNTYGQ
jgi:hypothetical protein